MNNAITPAVPAASNVEPAKSTQSTLSDGFANTFSGVMSDAQRNAKMATADDQDSNTAETASATMSATAVALLGPDGNPLPGTQPQVAWSGTVAAGDDHGASALAMAGDANNAAMTAPVVAPDMTTALQNALRQPLQGAAAIPTANIATAVDLNSPINSQLSNNLPVALLTSPNTNVLNGAGATTSAMDTDLQKMLTAVDSKPEFASMLNQTVNNSSTATSTTALTGALAPTLSYVQTARADQPMGTLPLPISHTNWGEQLGEGVRWMAGQHMQQADLRLNPPELGLLEVRIQMNSSDNASLTFCSPHSAVRDAVEHALPRLRDMLASGGVQLADVNVSQHSMSQHHAHSERHPQGSTVPAAGFTDPADEQATEMAVMQLPRHGQGLIDTYA